MVKRTFQGGWHIPADTEGAELCLAIGERNADERVTWLHSYVSDDRTKSFCVYEAPTPDAIPRSAAPNDLPVDVITQVRVSIRTSMTEEESLDRMSERRRP